MEVSFVEAFLGFCLQRQLFQLWMIGSDVEFAFK
ncbi:Uncharacterised protein [Vibrio cholerae]|nr:Uncharacterised protein [Vibrio cholerae]